MEVTQASQLVQMALDCICREYPHALVHVMNGPEDRATPKGLHPAFYGCYDWHSAVHGHWLLVRFLKQFDLPQSAQMRQSISRNLTADNIQEEAAYFLEPNRASFERMYGWSWLLKLVSELHDWPEGAEWREAVRPLEETIVGLLVSFLPRQTYPIRVGTHANTAFSLVLSHEYAQTVGDQDLSALISARSMDYYLQDRDAPSHLEPGGADFLSPSLTEALLMSRLLEPSRFKVWLANFLPSLSFSPAVVSDRSDPQIGHLDGLNLSRTWCLRGIAAVLHSEDPARERCLEMARSHEEASLPHLSSGHYSGDHWLATFAALALQGT